MASLRKIGQTYCVRYRKNGKEFSKKIGKNIPKATATKLLRQFEEKLALEKLGLKEPENILIAEFLEEYLQWVSKNQAPKTFEVKCCAKKHFGDFLNQKANSSVLYLHEITTASIEKYKLYRVDTGVSNRTINIELNFISNVLSVAKEGGYNVADVKVKRLKETKKFPRCFSKDEIQLC